MTTPAAAHDAQHPDHETAWLDFDRHDQPERRFPKLSVLPGLARRQPDLHRRPPRPPMKVDGGLKGFVASVGGFLWTL